MGSRIDRNLLERKMNARHEAYTELMTRIQTGEARKAVIDEICITAETFYKGGTAYFCGNGGSAADCEHFVAEFECMEPINGIHLRAESLTRAAAVTAIGNDYGFEHIFERLLRNKAREGDVLYGISTSGKAVNVQRALDAAKDLGIYRVGIVGNGTRSMEIIKRSDTAIVIPSSDTQSIQQCYKQLLHDIWLSLVDVCNSIGNG